MAFSKTDRNSFIMLEAVLAVAVLSLGLVFIIQAMNRSIKISKTSSNYIRMASLAYEKMFELELAFCNYGLDSGRSEGSFGNSGYAYAYDVEKLEDSNLSRLILEIFYQGKAKKEELTVETYVRTKEQIP